MRRACLALALPRLTSFERRLTASPSLPRVVRDGATARHANNPDARPAFARLRELDPGRAGRGARSCRPCGRSAPAYACHVRAWGETTSTARAVQGVPGAVRHLCWPV